MGGCERRSSISLNETVGSDGILTSSTTSVSFFLVLQTRATDQREKDVLMNLIVEQELSVLRGLLSRIKLKGFTLPLHRDEPKMQTARDQCQKQDMPCPDLEHPTWR